MVSPKIQGIQRETSHPIAPCVLIMGHIHRRFGGRKGIRPVKRLAPIILMYSCIVTSISLPSLNQLNELILENGSAGLACSISPIIHLCCGSYFSLVHLRRVLYAVVDCLCSARVRSDRCRYTRASDTSRLRQRPSSWRESAESDWDHVRSARLV